jgi:hypothetical protein
MRDTVIGLLLFRFFALLFGDLLSALLLLLSHNTTR